MNKKSIYSISGYIFFALVSILLIVFGSLNDFNITKNLVDFKNYGFFPIFGLLVAELPTYLGAVLIGSLMLGFIKFDNRKKVKILGIGYSTCAFIIGTFFYETNVFRLDEFNNLSQTSIILIGIAATMIFLIASALIIYFVIKNATEDNRKIYHDVQALLLIIIANELSIATFFKYIASRPRPYYVFTSGDDLADALFKNWWQFNPFYVLKNSACKSLPSVHSVSAGTTMFIFPLLTLFSKKHNNDKMLQNWLFYLGGFFAIICAISRIYAGAHFMSDVGFGILLSVISGIISDIIFRKYFLKEQEKGE